MRVLLGVVFILVGFGAYQYFMFSPKRKKPTLRAQVQPRTLRIGELDRSFLVYVPPAAKANAALLVILHGTGEAGAKIRRYTGLEFDKLADEGGFVVAYPDGFKGGWNDCRIQGSTPAKVQNIDDLGFLQSLISSMERDHYIDLKRVFVVGFSNGGQMGFRLISQATEAVAGLVAIGANLPVAEHSMCTIDRLSPPVLLVHGTNDPTLCRVALPLRHSLKLTECRIRPYGRACPLKLGTTKPRWTRTRGDPRIGQ